MCYDPFERYVHRHHRMKTAQGIMGRAVVLSPLFLCRLQCRHHAIGPKGYRFCGSEQSYFSFIILV